MPCRAVERVSVPKLPAASLKCWMINWRTGPCRLRVWNKKSVVSAENPLIAKDAMSGASGNVNLTPELDRFVATKVKSGRCENALPLSVA